MIGRAKVQAHHAVEQDSPQIISCSSFDLRYSSTSLLNATRCSIARGGLRMSYDLIAYIPMLLLLSKLFRSKELGLAHLCASKALFSLPLFSLCLPVMLHDFRLHVQRPFRPELFFLGSNGFCLAPNTLFPHLRSPSSTETLKGRSFSFTPSLSRPHNVLSIQQLGLHLLQQERSPLNSCGACRIKRPGKPASCSSSPT